MNNLFEKPFTWENREHFLKALPHKEQVRFALFCATQVKHLLTDERSLKALKVVELFLEDKATKEECQEATNGAASAYSSASNNVAYAIDDAVYHMAYAAACITHAAAAATHAAAAVAIVVTRVLPEEQTKEEQMNYLRNLLLENLSEEDKECWLLVASI